MPSLLDHALEQSLPDDRKRARRARHDDVEVREPFRQFVECNGVGCEPVGELDPTLERAVRDGDRSRLARSEVRCSELDHLPGSDQQQSLLLKRRKNPLRKFDRRGRHRDRGGADVGLGPHVLRDGEGALEQTIEHEPERARRLRRSHRVLHLAENLRLAQHNRIEAARHAKRVRNRLFLRQGVDMRRERVRFEVVRGFKPARDG